MGEEHPDFGLPDLSGGSISATPIKVWAGDPNNIPEGWFDDVKVEKKAQKCPVCDGSGEFGQKTVIGNDGTKWIGGKECHGCNGKGWVVV